MAQKEYNMEFITKEDFKTHMYAGIINAISDDDDEMLMDAIATAMAEAGGYLNRYDTDVIFNSTDSADKAKYSNLRTYIKDLAKWHFINICNVSIDLELAKTRYDEAIARLKEIQSGKVSPKGWALLTESEDEAAFVVASRPKRGNYY